MKKSELIQMIKEEHKYIKNLLEQKERIENLLKEKAEIEKQLDEIECSENPEDGAPEVDETIGKGLGVNRRASHQGEAGERLKVEEEKIQESAIRKTIRKQLFESYGLKKN